MRLSDPQNKAMAKALTQMGGFCASIGKSRNYINHVVCGRQQLPGEMKQKITRFTGINFWALAHNHQPHKKVEL